MKKKIGIASIVFACFAVLIIIFSVIRANWEKVDVNRDINSFRQYDYSDFYLTPDYKERLVVFPTEIKGNINEYFHLQKTEDFSSVKNNVYLDITYTAEEYQKEIERLSNWERQYTYNEQQHTAKFLQDKECKHFNYPAFIASHNCTFLVYEYALLLDDYRIVYVYVNSIKEEDMLMEDEYLPKRYYEEVEKFPDVFNNDKKIYDVYYNNFIYDHLEDFGI